MEASGCQRKLVQGFVQGLDMVEEDGEEAGSGDGGQADGGGGQASPCFTLRLRFRLRALFGLSPFCRLHPINVGPGYVHIVKYKNFFAISCDGLT